jgi:hypothetical protein
MKSRQYTEQYKRVVCTVDVFVLQQIDAECKRLGNCSRACVLRMALDVWAQRLASTQDTLTDQPAAGDLVNVA